jgi:glutamate synthase domain-containing protein 3
MTTGLINNRIEEHMEIDAAQLSTTDLNVKLREMTKGGAEEISIKNVCGQRYIGTDLPRNLRIDIHGTPGNDLGTFLNGPTISVYGNAQDGVGNTMDSGKIIVHGHAGDITGLSARGGSIFIRDYVGYRAGIHMKEYNNKKPSLVIGGSAQDFLGEYMAGGIIVMLGMDLSEGEEYRAHYIGTGMHGGVIYVRGSVEDHQLGKEVGIVELDENDRRILNELVGEFCAHFEFNTTDLLNNKFIKLIPLHLRPYGKLYAY